MSNYLNVGAKRIQELDKDGGIISEYLCGSFSVDGITAFVEIDNINNFLIFMENTSKDRLLNYLEEEIGGDEFDSIQPVIDYNDGFYLFDVYNEYSNKKDCSLRINGEWCDAWLTQEDFDILEESKSEGFNKWHFIKLKNGNNVDVGMIDSVIIKGE